MATTVLPRVPPELEEIGRVAEHEYQRLSIRIINLSVRHGHLFFSCSSTGSLHPCSKSISLLFVNCRVSYLRTIPNCTRVLYLGTSWLHTVFGETIYYMREFYRFSGHKMQLQASVTCGDKMLRSVQLRVQVIILRVVSKCCIAAAWCNARAAS
jgi:hypothetical protein